jgi:hypothetical protein
MALIRGAMRPVVNLGWLRRHWREVSSFKVIKNPNTNCNDVEVFNRGGVLIYQTDFASAEVLWDWLGRPIFKGCNLDWFGEKTICGAKNGEITITPNLLYRCLLRGI